MKVSCRGEAENSRCVLVSKDGGDGVASLPELRGVCVPSTIWSGINRELFLLVEACKLECEVHVHNY